MSSFISSCRKKNPFQRRKISNKTKWMHHLFMIFLSWAKGRTTCFIIPSIHFLSLKNSDYETDYILFIFCFVLFTVEKPRKLTILCSTKHLKTYNWTESAVFVYLIIETECLKVKLSLIFLQRLRFIFSIRWYRAI